MYYLLCYDITDTRLRTRLARLLERAGCIRIQYSVWVAADFTPKRLGRLRQNAHQLLQTYSDRRQPQDSLIALPLPPDYSPNGDWWGEKLHTLKKSMENMPLVVFV